MLDFFERFSRQISINIFYPIDFTFVCPTKIITFSDRAQEFRKIRCEVVGISTDLKFSQMKYSKTPRDQGGLEKLNIMSISDIGKVRNRLQQFQNISTSFGCLIDNETDEEYGVSFRGTYIMIAKEF